MYEAIFFEAKNGSKTCKIDKSFLHSSYNPEVEAERFVKSLAVPFNPSVVFAVEPGLSYCAEHLKKAFPKTRVYAIRFMEDFSRFDGLFSGGFTYSPSSPLEFEKKLSESFTEEELCSALFLEWPPSAKIFLNEMKSLSSSIKRILENARTVLVTKSAFSKRWFKNALVFSTNIKNVVSIKKGSEPVAICAGGPSLEKSLGFLKKNRERLFVVALSSSLCALIENGIEPDLALSTDGGFWAKNHLEYAYQKHSFPVALSCEGAFPKKLAEKCRILPLLYSEGPGPAVCEKSFTDLDIPFERAVRNGTVSGTALEFALEITEGPVFALGLDLECGGGKNHAEPNRNENFNRRNENRLSTCEKNTVSRTLNSKSLDIYREWFKENSEKVHERFFRVSENCAFLNGLGKIRDIKNGEAEKIIEDARIHGRKISFTEERTLGEDEKSKIIKNFTSFIKEKCDTDVFLDEFFPSEKVLLNKLKAPDERARLLEKIERRKKDFIESLERLWEGFA